MPRPQAPLGHEARTGSHALRCMQQARWDMPPDTLAWITKAALAAEGNSLAAWLRLSMVSRAWREALAGLCRMPCDQWPP